MPIKTSHFPLEIRYRTINDEVSNISNHQQAWLSQCHYRKIGSSIIRHFCPSPSEIRFSESAASVFAAVLHATPPEPPRATPPPRRLLPLPPSAARRNQVCLLKNLKSRKIKMVDDLWMIYRLPPLCKYWETVTQNPPLWTCGPFHMNGVLIRCFSNSCELLQKWNLTRFVTFSTSNSTTAAVTKPLHTTRTLPIWTWEPFNFHRK